MSPISTKWRRPVSAPWLTESVIPVAQDAVRRALMDIGILEVPPGSNRSGVIDEYNRRAKVPEGSYWCASAAGAWWLDVGLLVPDGYASCDAWMTWAKHTDRWRPAGSRPPIGGMVLYGVPGDAQHIGMIVRVSDIVLSVEGNTTVEGANFGASRNGIAVSLKEVTTKDPVLGYVTPLPAK